MNQTVGIIIVVIAVAVVLYFIFKDPKPVQKTIPPGIPKPTSPEKFPAADKEVQ